MDLLRHGAFPLNQSIIDLKLEKMNSFPKQIPISHRNLKIILPEMIFLTSKSNIQRVAIDCE
jgi:hypothetical protein